MRHRAKTKRMHVRRVFYMLMLVCLAYLFWPEQIPLKSEFKGHKNSVHVIAIHPDNRLVASGAWGEIRFSDVDTGKQLSRPVMKTGYAAPTIQFLSSTEMMYTHTHRGVVIVDTLDWSERKVLRDNAHDVSAHAHSIVASCSSNGRQIAAYFERYAWTPSEKWDLENREHCRLYVWKDLDSSEVLELHLGTMSHPACLVFHPQLPHIAAIDSSGRIQSWSLDDGEIVLSADTDNSFGRNRRPCSACAFSPSGHLICTPSSVIQYPTGQPV